MLFTLMICSLATASPTVEIADLDALAAARAPAPGRAAVLWPSLGVPALVAPGGEVEVLIAESCATGPAVASLVLVGEPGVVLPAAVEGRATVRVPLGLGDDLYHLQLDLPGCDRVDGVAPVRVIRDGGSGLVAVLSDEQLGDPLTGLPGWPLNGDLHPEWVPGDAAASRRIQVRREITFRHPDLVLYPGDVVFGMDYGVEYPAIAELWSSTPLATFAVPGNHDAYALHSVELAEGWERRLLGALACGVPRAALSGVWAAVAVAACMVDELGDSLVFRPEADGIEVWRETLGAESWALSWRGTRLVGLNTYQGSPARRTAVPLSPRRLEALVGRRIPGLSSLDPDLGAPLTDNFGGLVEPQTSTWVMDQVAAARDRGEAVVLVAHHDPSGTFKGGRAVFPVEPFGTDPIARGGFEVWNHDLVAGETDKRHSGTLLLEGTATGRLTTWILGHTHRDDRHQLRLGVDRVVDLVQTTSGGSDVLDAQGYRGYRILELGSEGPARVEADPERGWASVPEGHLWVEEVPRDDGPPDQEVRSGLPEPVPGRLRFSLPSGAWGYAFSTQDGQPLLPSDLTDAGGQLVLYLEVVAPAGSGTPVATRPEELSRLAVSWEALPEHPPPSLTLHGPGRTVPRRAHRPLRARVGCPLGLELRSEAPLLRVLWSLDERGREGELVEWPVAERGTLALRATAWDAWGARTEVEREVRVRRTWPWSPRCRTVGAE